MDRLSHSPWALAGSWVFLRLISPVLLGVLIPIGMHDVVYYFEAIQKLAHGTPIGSTLVEYPLPVIPLLEIPWFLGARTAGVYVWGFVSLILLTDLVWCLFLYRACLRHETNFTPLWWWLGFSAALSPVIFVRFDMWTATLAAFAVLWWATHPRVVGALIALGAGIKLWPALLWLPSLGGTTVRVRQAWGFALTGVALVVSCLAWGGWDRLISPLTWQKDRGLQVESLAATFPMIARAFNPSAYHVEVSRYNAFEIAGPGTSLFLSASTIITAVGLLATVGLLVWWWRGAINQDPLAVALIVIFITLIMIATNKTFSPQYLVWLGPVSALTILWKPQGLPAVHLRRLQVLLLALAALTTLIFPGFYSVLMFWSNPAGAIAMTAALALRNVGIVAALALTVMTLHSLDQQKRANCR